MIQLVGVEYSWAQSGVPDRYLRAFQIQHWLKMVADDIPDLQYRLWPLLRLMALPARARTSS